MYALLKNPLVDCDLEEAALWYNRRNPAIAERLIDEAQKAIRLAGVDPLRFPLCFGDYRRVRLSGFRYAVYFRVRDESVRILALIHGARDLETLLQNRDALDE
jgi:toxin ParE1/3/4